MRYAFLYGCIAVVAGYFSMPWRSASPILVWVAVCFGLLALSYLLNTTVLFGRKLGGQLALRSLLLLPYLVVYWLGWRFRRRFSSVPAFSRVSDRLLVGRRLLAYEIPPEVTQVIDLAPELSEASAIVKRLRYYSYPILDGAAPRSAELTEFIDRLNLDDEVTYVHCAAGRERTAMVAMALLLQKGVCKDRMEAEELIRSTRPSSKVTRSQHEFLLRFENTIRRQPKSDDAIRSARPKQTLTL
jgi:protein-tyrosine phosphatase